jgi:DNA-directed RNA polymerase specialized sigma24 family protein
LVYEELRRIAAFKMGNAPPQTIQPTALVHEAWLRLGGDNQPTWKNRAHFFTSAAAPDAELLGVDEALEKLARIDPRKAELVKLRYFTGLTFDEAAEVLNIAVPTAKEWWAYARAWLSVELKRSA